MKRLVMFLYGMTLVFGAVANVQATTLQDLFDGQTITVGDKLFSDWTLIENDFSADPSNIDVNPLPDSLNQGLQYVANDEWLVSDGQQGFVVFAFTYDLTVLNPLLTITDASLEITDFAFEGEGGAFEIQNAIFPPSLIVNVSANNRFGTFDLFDSQQFAPDFAPQTFLDDVETIINFEDTVGNTVSLEAFKVRYSQSPVPEPSTLFLIGTGLVGLAGFRKKFKA